MIPKQATREQMSSSRVEQVERVTVLLMKTLSSRHPDMQEATVAEMISGLMTAAMRMMQGALTTVDPEHRPMLRAGLVKKCEYLWWQIVGVVPSQKNGVH